jgi:hypothetical protein
MATGLLESLRKYRPREGKDPLENFITEAFSWILNNHLYFSEFFLIEIMKKNRHAVKRYRQEKMHMDNSI